MREPAVAGLFYPEDADDLAAAVATHLDGEGSTGRDDGPGADLGARSDAGVSSRVDDGADEPRALIAPHAGYRYSGAAAGAAYRTLAESRASIDRVVLVGPAHRVA
ncbi:MAG: AmmeMemoRadiSam system protein B, partial [Acidimicrobiales bacterium]|nr:AmmeMemoRadiSam system protein B [Acidimicrobiales bacterium]